MRHDSWYDESIKSALVCILSYDFQNLGLKMMQQLVYVVISVVIIQTSVDAHKVESRLINPQHFPNLNSGE